MASYKILFFGNKGSGKTQLNRQLTHNNIELFNPNSESTVGADFLSRSFDLSDKLLLWDIAGDERYRSIRDIFYKNADVGIFCLDLTEEIDEQQIKEEIRLFKTTNPKSPVLLVGTKADDPKANIDALRKTNVGDLCNKMIITSAKDGTGVNELFTVLCSLCAEQKNTLWNEAVRKLLVNLAHIPHTKSEAIQEELEKLKKMVFIKPKKFDDTMHIQAQAIEDFSINCSVILDGKYTNVLNAVLTVAAAAAVTVIAALVGFGIGFALGLWSGPGAFITGLVSGCTAAVAVATSSTALGFIAGGITAYGLFKKPKEMEDIQEFTKEITPLCELAVR